MSERELRIWAEAHAPAGCPQAVAVLRLLDHVAALRDRLAGQCEILSRRAERRERILFGLYPCGCVSIAQVEDFGRPADIGRFYAAVGRRGLRSAGGGCGCSPWTTGRSGRRHAARTWPPARRPAT